MLSRYRGFYLHEGERVRWEASASAPLLEVRALQHGRPKLRAGTRLIPAPLHWVTTSLQTPGLEIGHLLICDAALGDEARCIFWGVLLDDLVRRCGVVMQGGAYRTASFEGQSVVLHGLPPDTQYRSLCALTNSDPWL